MTGPGDGWFADFLRSETAPIAKADDTAAVPSFARPQPHNTVGDYLHAGREVAAGAAETLAPMVAQQAFPFVNPGAIAALIQRLKVGNMVGGTPTATDSALREVGGTTTNGALLASAAPSLLRGIPTLAGGAVARLTGLLR